MAPASKKLSKPIFKTSNPFSETKWPEISPEHQDVILDLLCNLLEPIGTHRQTHTHPSKGKKRKRASPTETTRPLPPNISKHVLVGLNSCTRHLSQLAARSAPANVPASQQSKSSSSHSSSSNNSSANVSQGVQTSTNKKTQQTETGTETVPTPTTIPSADDPTPTTTTTSSTEHVAEPKPLSLLIIPHPNPSSSLAHAHLPTLVYLSSLPSTTSLSTEPTSNNPANSPSKPSTTSSPSPRPTHLIPLPTPSEPRLATALHLPRVSAIGILEGAPGADALVDYVRKNVELVECRWVEESLAAEWKGVKTSVQMV